MSMQLKTSLKLSQNLRMTPQLQQAIKMLQLSRMELEAEIRKEINENPLLEEFADTVEDDPSAELSSAVQEKDKQSDDQDPRSQEDSDWEDYSDLQYKGLSATSSIPEDVNYDNFISKAQTLKEHLHWQASLSGFNEEEMDHVSMLITYIDDNGYIKMPLDQIAAEEGIDLKDLEEILPFVQEFDPPGVGCRDLKECLLIQAEHFEEATTDVLYVIENHLKDLEKKNYEEIARGMNLKIEEVVEICKIILSFDPKPGRAFQSEDTHYVTPDVYIYKVGEEYVVALNEDGIPKLKISNLYKDLVKQEGKAGNKETKEYLQEKLRAAVWLIKSIQQRQKTIYKVTESIIKHQTEFFEKGAAFIRPMILKDIANDIEMHESTVSRVTTNKYVHTPLGVFELKYFFNSGISRSDGGDSLASESVKLKIKGLVAKENPQKPLSDQKIVELLKKEGLQIARRTVAKYRDVLGILPSSSRKKYF
jgi:RNA polymerase sigma-54 factor